MGQALRRQIVYTRWKSQFHTKCPFFTEFLSVVRRRIIYFPTKHPGGQRSSADFIYSLLAVAAEPTLPVLRPGGTKLSDNEQENELLIYVLIYLFLPSKDVIRSAERTSQV